MINTPLSTRNKPSITISRALLFGFVLVFSLASCGGGSGGGDSNNNIPNPVVTISDESANEDAGITLIASLDLAVPGGFTVELFSADGSATVADSDYTPISAQSLTFAGIAGETQSFTLLTTPDSIVEPDETVIISMDNVSNSDVDITDTAIATLLDDDTPKILISDVSGFENNGALIFSATLNVQVPGGFTVDISTADGSATVADSDYSEISAQLLSFTGNAGEIQTFTLTPTPDLNFEPDETVIISMSNISNIDVDIADTATATILDDDTPRVTISNASGDENDGPITLTASLNNAVSGGFTVQVNTVDGTATLDDSDYTQIISQVLTFAGNTGETQTITFSPAPDTKVELDEVITVTMANTSNSSIDITDTATVTINNDDTSTVTIADVSGNEDAGPITLTATLSNPVSGGFAVLVNTTDSSATVADSDYTPIVSQVLTFAGNAGETQVFTLSSTTDITVEASETLTVSMTGASKANISVIDTALVTIINDDEANVTISDISGNENAGPITLTATLNNPVSGGFTVQVNTSDGTAFLSDSDYTQIISQVLTFAGNLGETQTLTLNPAPDTRVELDETINITMANSSNSSVDITDTATVTINNDDTAAIIIANASGNENAGPITLTATLSNPVSGGLTVQVNTADDSATLADSDYTPIVSEVLTFSGNAGETQTFTFSPTSDTIVEPDESVSISMSGSSNSNVIVMDTATVIINNDDFATVTIADVSGNEDAGSINLTATLDNAVSGGFTVQLNTSNGSATLADSDYTAILSQVLSFSGNAGETNVFTLTPTADSKVESNETVNVSMAAASNTDISITDTAIVTILDDDTATVTITNASGFENDGSISVTATLDKFVAGGFSVEVSTSDGSATLSDTDYNSIIGQLLSFAGTAGESKTFNLSPIRDTKVEGDETVVVNLANSSNGSVDISSTATVTIINDDIDSTPPSAEISFPPDISLTEGTQVIVNGTASDTQTPVTVVRVNGIDATTSDGFATWQAIVPLIPGNNILTLEVADMALNGNANADQVTIQRGDLSVSKTPDTTNPFPFIEDIGLDPNRDRLIVLTRNDSNLVYAVDLNNGARTIVATTVASSDPTHLVSPSEFIIDNNLMYILDSFGTGKIISINLLNGTRAVITAPTGFAVSSLNALIDGSDMVLDKTRNRLIVKALNADTPFLDRLIAVDLSSGNRTAITTSEFTHNRLLINTNNSKLLANDFNNSTSSQELIEFDFAANGSLSTAQVISSNTIPDGNNVITFPRSMVLNGNTLYLHDDNRILNINLLTGARGIISDNVSVPNSINPLINSTSSIVFDSTRNRIIFFSNWSVDQRIMAIEPGIGTRVILSN